MGIFVQAILTWMIQHPVAFQDAISRADGEKWKEAIKKELQSFEENKACESVKVPDSGSVVDCKWVFKRKVDSESKMTYRARLVAKGFTQKYGL